MIVKLNARDGAMHGGVALRQHRQAIAATSLRSVS